MSDGWIFLALTALICLGAFLNGLRFSRMSEEKILDERTLIEVPPFLGRGRTKVEQARLFGRISMIVAPLFLLVAAAFCFGLLGPAGALEIDLGGAA